MTRTEDHCHWSSDQGKNSEQNGSSASKLQLMRWYLWGGQSPRNCCNNLLWSWTLSCLVQTGPLLLALMINWVLCEVSETLSCGWSRTCDRSHRLQSFLLIQSSCSARIWSPTLFVNNFLHQGVRHAAFVSCVFIGWQELQFVARRISPHRVLTTHPSC